MKLIVAALIAGLVGCGIPQTACADSSSDSGDGSQANNITIGLLVVAVVVVIAVGIGWGQSDSIVQTKDASPISLYARTDDGDAVKYEQGEVVTTGLAFAADF